MILQTPSQTHPKSLMTMQDQSFYPPKVSILCANLPILPTCPTVLVSDHSSAVGLP